MRWRATKPDALDPGPGWLRSRFMLTEWPRAGIAACGRPMCEVCGPPPILSEALQPVISNMEEKP